MVLKKGIKLTGDHLKERSTYKGLIYFIIIIIIIIYLLLLLLLLLFKYFYALIAFHIVQHIHK